MYIVVQACVSKRIQRSGNRSLLAAATQQDSLLTSPKKLPPHSPVEAVDGGGQKFSMRASSTLNETSRPDMRYRYSKKNPGRKVRFKRMKVPVRSSPCIMV
jgi:hypothetical protein